MAAKVKRPSLETSILTIVKDIVKLPLTPSRHPSIIQPDGHFVHPVIRPSSNRTDISSIPSSVYLSRPVIQSDEHFVHPVIRLFKPDGHFMHPVIRLFKNRSMPIRVSLPAVRSPPCLRVEAEKLSTIFKTLA
jgi:hypothetical protein